MCKNSHSRKKPSGYKACLNIHIRHHTGTKPSECKGYRKTYTCFSYHLRTHSAEMLYMCKKYEKAFKNS
nr:PREDICTED: zinc finger protein 878-like [Equus przewalskii]